MRRHHGCPSTIQRQPWIVLSRVQKQFQNVQVFGIESNGIYITLSKPPPKPSITGTQAVAAGAWKHKDTPSAPLVNVGDTQIDSSQDEEQEAGAKKKHKSEAPVPYEIIDCGGAGNCGWNCGSKRSNEMVNGFVGCLWKQRQSDVTFAS